MAGLAEVLPIAGVAGALLPLLAVGAALGLGVVPALPGRRSTGIVVLGSPLSARGLVVVEVIGPVGVGSGTLEFSGKGWGD